jgi:3-phenylpropionate/trans-cinnamate dioxygenase ferredoxin reductase subunit
MADPGSSIVILGAGQAGATCALALRRRGHAGPITLIGEERDPPHDRPPLSKEVLRDGVLPEAAWRLPPERAASAGIVLRLGVAAVAIDRDARSLRLSDGRAVGYARLVLATGGEARLPPGVVADGARLFALRRLADARALHARLRPGLRVLVLGAGWLGLEVAAAARLAGAAVTVAEAAPHALARLLPAAPARHIAARHVAQGVAFRFGAPAQVALAADGVEARFPDGSLLHADLAVLCLGLAARDELARDAGLPCRDGVLVDTAGRSGDPAVLAIGDLARDAAGQRLESWQNARQSAERAAAFLLGQDLPAPEAPWFWSQQYDAAIQVAGLPSPEADAVAIEDGDRPLWRIEAAGVPRAVIGIGRPRELRAAIRSLTPPDPVALEETR